MPSQIVEEIKCKLLSKFNHIVECDYDLLKKKGDLAPKVVGFSYCPRCGEIDAAISFVNTESEDSYRIVFPYIVIYTMRAVSSCNICGLSALPLGYAHTSTAWMYSVEKSDGKAGAEVSAAKTRSGRVEIYVAVLVSILGKEFVVKKIMRRGRRINLQSLDLPVGVDIKGRFVLPLQSYSDEEIEEAIRKLKDESA
ncbi:MAG: hypothetical protein QXX29_04955 [Nitrososphaerota archaeon]